MSNGWGLWCVFFVPAFVGGFLMGVSTILMLLRARRKKGCAAKAAPAAAPSSAPERRRSVLPDDVLLPLEKDEGALCRMRAA